LLDVPNSPYRVIATSLLRAEIDAADRVATALRDEGWPNASRSLVIREAIDRLLEDLRGQTPEQIFRNFIENRGRRLPRGATTKDTDR